MGIFDKITGRKDYAPETVPVRALVAPQGFPPPGGFPPMGMPPSTMQMMANQPGQLMARPQPSPWQPQEMPGLPAPSAPMPPLPQGALQPMRMPPSPVLPMSQRMPGLDEDIHESQDVFTSGMDQAPVFIKIDRYEDILGELAAVKSTVENVRTLMEIFTIMRDVNADAVGVLDSLAKEIERSQIKLDKILGRMEPVEERVRGSKYDVVRRRQPKELTEIEDRIGKLRDEIKRLGTVQ